MFTKDCALIAATLGVILQVTPAFAQSYGAGGFSNTSGYSNSQPNVNAPQGCAYMPAGMTLSASLATSISTEAAKPGDFVQATLTQPITLAEGIVPSGTIIEGHVVEAKAGGFLGRSGRLTVKFDRLRTPSGASAQLAAHVVGNFGNYKQIANGSGSFAGEGMGTKVGQTLIRGAIGAGAGAALGTAVGAIAGRGQQRVAFRPVYGPYGHQMSPVGYVPQVRGGAASGAGRGAWSGAAIGGGAGVAQSLLLRQGKDVVIPSGTQVQLQLDGPATIQRNPAGYGGAV